MTADPCTHSFPDPFPQPISQIGDCRGCGISYQEVKDAMTTPSDELRAASARLRELAADATEGPWFAKHLEAAWGEQHDAVLIGRGKALATLPYDHNGHLNADYAAAMGPPVGNALADWLDEEADRRDASVVAAIQIWGNAEHPDAVAWLTTGLGKGSAPALDLARQINTGSQT